LKFLACIQLGSFPSNSGYGGRRTVDASPRIYLAWMLRKWIQFRYANGGSINAKNTEQ
jgi:hypothetical protein